MFEKREPPYRTIPPQNETMDWFGAFIVKVAKILMIIAFVVLSYSFALAGEERKKEIGVFRQKSTKFNENLM